MLRRRNDTPPPLRARNQPPQFLTILTRTSPPRPLPAGAERARVRWARPPVQHQARPSRRRSPPHLSSPPPRAERDLAAAGGDLIETRATPARRHPAASCLPTTPETRHPPRTRRTICRAPPPDAAPRRCPPPAASSLPPPPKTPPPPRTRRTICRAPPPDAAPRRCRRHPPRYARHHA